MLGLKEICALFAAGSMGAVSVVTVQKVTEPTPMVRKASAPKKASPRRAVAAKKPVVAPLARPQAIAIDDCPIPGTDGMSLADLSPVPFDAGPAGNGRYPLPPPYYGGGGLYPVDYIPGGGGGGGGTLNPDDGGGIPVDPEDPTTPVDPDGPNIPDEGGGIPVVPEPASWVMMIGGIGLVGLALRRTRTANTPAATDDA